MTEFYDHGRRFGTASAFENRRKIEKSETSEEMGKLAGEIMSLAISRGKEWFMNTQNWKLGFFEGFMLKSEELRRIK